MTVWDWLVMLAYAAVVVGVGLLASRGTRSGEGHLRAGRDLPGWAVVFSVLATEVSAATYIGVPETAFKGNWTYLQFAVGALLAKIVLAYVVLPLYWRLDLVSIYGFLGQRLGPATHRVCAGSFLAGRLVASGVRLFIAALAFHKVTGTSLEGGILLMAAISTIYTLFGGLKAVVWTDVLQGTIFVVGAGCALVIGVERSGLGLDGLLEAAAGAGKLRTFQLADPTEPWWRTVTALGPAVVGGLFLGLATHGTDQENVQHLLNTRTARASRWSIVASGLATFPVVLLFLAVGTVLWAFHREHPPVAYGVTGEEARRIFPNFILHVIPSGLRGLVFAGLFAAAISSLGATLNAVTAAALTDLRPRGARPVSLAQVRGLNLVFGTLLAGVGVAFAAYARDSGQDLVQFALSAMTMLYGGILGIFATALVLGRRPRDAHGVLALAIGVATGILLFFHPRLLGLEGPLLAWVWYIPISAGLTLLAGMIFARVAPRPFVSP
jgi:SSS family solute:Na+ symporter